MNGLREQMEKISYDNMNKNTPGVLAALKDEMKGGQMAKQIEKRLGGKKYQTSLIAQSTILAAYYISKNPQVLTEVKE